MIGKTRFHVTLAAIAGFFVLLLAASTASAQEIRTMNDGQTQVRYWGGCTVYYDYAGRRINHQSCGGDQLQRADALMASRQQAYGGNWGNNYGYNNGNYGYGNYSRPRVDFDQSGYGRVTFPEGCSVSYDNSGRRISHQSCGQEQLAIADRAVAGGRQGGWNSGWNPDWNSGGGWNGYGAPTRIFMSSSGSGHVLVGNNCTVYYDGSGRRTSHEGCGQAELQQADQALYSWRRNQGYSGSPYYN